MKAVWQAWLELSGGSTPDHCGPPVQATPVALSGRLEQIGMNTPMSVKLLFFLGARFGIRKKFNFFPFAQASA